jgi:hypothetical protein
MPPRRPVTTVRQRPQLPQVPYQGLFKEARYMDGQPYPEPVDESAEAADGD